jgi:hypothetical protein
MTGPHFDKAIYEPGDGSRYVEPVPLNPVTDEERKRRQELRDRDEQDYARMLRDDSDCT